jgi:hypothetical protein
MKIEEVLSIYKEWQVDDLLHKYTGITLNERNLSYDKIKKYYKFLGNSSSNGSNVGQLTSGEKGLVERITNAIDAVIENQKAKYNIGSAKDSNTIIKKAFPKYYENMQEVMKDNADKSLAKDADNQVILAVNDGSKSNKPTFDVIDNGIGLLGNEFENTILSINHGNKLSRDKSYLIGAFGQGGSTSLPFTYATIILSKKNSHISFTIIKRVELTDYKNMVYVYMTIDDVIPEVEYTDFNSGDEYLDNFINNAESGTLVRMIETEISKRFRDNEVTKPGMLSDYLNTELFNVGLPVKVIENRADFKNNEHLQNRSVYGSQLKLKTSKRYVKKDYCGTINIEHNSRSYNIDFYTLLPAEENKWGSESECKKVFEQFNVYYDPIIYTVNGQTITTERYTKLNNAGLNFLKYRLLVVINLDILETEKYKFFTTDRARIVDSDLTHGFLDKVIKALAENEKLKEINSIIAEKSVSSSIDQDLLDEVSKQVKSEYNKFLKTGTILPGPTGVHYHTTDEEIYEDHIVTLDITSDARKFYKDENVKFVVTTKAQKHINEEALIYCFVDGKAFYDFQKASMNARIQYTINSGSIKPGMHTVKFEYYKSDGGCLSSEEVVFEIINEKTPEKKQNSPSKALDLNITIVDEATLICEVSRDMVNKKIDVKLCLDSDQLRSEVYGNSASSDEISKIKNRIIKPLALFSLFLGESYDNIEKDEDKNNLMISYIKAFVGSVDSKIIDIL